MMASIFNVPGVESAERYKNCDQNLYSPEVRDKRRRWFERNSILHKTTGVSIESSLPGGFVEKDSPQLMAAIAEFMSKSPREKRVYKERYVEPFEITDDTHPAKIEHYQLNWLDREQERGVRVPWGQLVRRGQVLGEYTGIVKTAMSTDEDASKCEHGEYYGRVFRDKLMDFQLQSICGRWCNKKKLALDPGDSGTALALMNDWRGVRDSSGALLQAPNATWVTVFDYSMQTVHLVFLACTDLQGHQELLTDYGEEYHKHMEVFKAAFKAEIKKAVFKHREMAAEMAADKKKLAKKQLEMEKKIEEAEAETAAQISAAQAAAAASAEEAAGSRAAAADAAAEINAMKEQLAVAESTEAQLVEQCTNALKLKESQQAESAAAAAKLQQQAAAFNVQLKARHADALKSLSAEFKREAAARKAANKQAICLGAQLQRAEEKAAELAAKLAQMSEQLEAQRVAQLKAEVAAKQSEERSLQLKTELQGMKDAKAAAEEEAQRSQAELKAITEALSNLHLQPPPRAPSQQPQACEDATPAREAPCALPPTDPIEVLSCDMSSAAEDPPILPPPPPRPLLPLPPAVSAPPQLTAPPEHVPAHAARPAAATYGQQQQQQKEWPGEDEPIQDNNAKELNGSVPDSANEGSCLHPSNERSQAASYKGTFDLPVGRQQAPRRKATAWDLCNGPEPGYITEMRCRKKAAKARRRAKKNRVLRPVAGRVAKNVGAQSPAQMQGPAHGRKSSQSQGSPQFQLPLHPPAQLPAQRPDQAPARQGDDISSGAPGWQGWVPEPEEGWGGSLAEEAPYQLGTAQQPHGMPPPLEQPQQRQQESVGSEERKMEPSGGQPLTCNGADMQRAVIKFERAQQSFKFTGKASSAQASSPLPPPPPLPWSRQPNQEAQSAKQPRAEVQNMWPGMKRMDANNAERKPSPPGSATEGGGKVRVPGNRYFPYKRASKKKVSEKYFCVVIDPKTGIETKQPWIRKQQGHGGDNTIMR